MVRIRTSSAPEVLVPLDRASGEPLHRQLEQGLREAIRSGRLGPGCPETAGGLPTPRPAAQRSAADGRVRTSAGADVTDAYERGADHAVRLARASGATGAVLKARSPSCGCREVYDGSFTRTRVAGEGVTAERLRLEGLEVRSEEELSGWEPAPG